MFQPGPSKKAALKVWRVHCLFQQKLRQCGHCREVSSTQSTQFFRSEGSQEVGLSLTHSLTVIFKTVNHCCFNWVYVDNYLIQPKLYTKKFIFKLEFQNATIIVHSMVKFSWKTTKRKTLTISPCCAILKSNPNCTAWWNSFGRLPKGKR